MRVPAGTRLFDTHQPCAGFPVVFEGCVSVALAAPDGRRLELYRVEPGAVCVVSATSLFGQRPALAMGEALTVTELGLISAADFERACEAEPALRRWLLGLLSDRLAELMALVDAVAFQRLDQRLASLLLARGPVLTGGQQALAEDLGTVREMVSRLLGRFERNGWVRLGRERVEVIDATALRQFCAGSTPL
jgi:CRP/FNR family transcriptional regulator